MTTSGGSARKRAGSRDLLSVSTLTTLFAGELVNTAALRPVLLIYRPPHIARQAELLLTQNGDFTHPIYRQHLDLSEQSGLLRIELQPHPDLEALTPNTPYDWRFTLLSQTPGRGQPPSITQRLQRVAIAPDVQAQLNQASPQEKISLYQSLGLPYDACMELDQLRRTAPVEPWIEETWSTWMVRKGWIHLATVPPIR